MQEDNLVSLNIGNHLLLGLTTLMCLSQSCTVVLLRVVCTNVIYAVIIFKALVDVVQGAHMPILGMNALNGNWHKQEDCFTKTLFHECRVTHEKYENFSI